MKIRIPDIDVVFLSYDEPRADEHYADLLSKCSTAKRVHGVKGFDEAHKACARAAETDRFITVDGDNIVNESFLSAEFEFPDSQHDCVFSWGSKNVVNGLVYGNGSLKCWPTEFVMNMRTHENAEADDEAVDFCWDEKYIQVEGVFSETYSAGSPFQAFRSGFREGVKMTLDQGRPVTLHDIDMGALWHGNVKRLAIWCSVGSDVENGLWSMYGTRLGVYMTNLTDWNHSVIADYDWFSEYWNSEVKAKFELETGGEYCRYTDYRWDQLLLWDHIVWLGDQIRRRMGLKIADLDPDASLFFKEVYVAPSRTGYD